LQLPDAIFQNMNRGADMAGVMRLQLGVQILNLILQDGYARCDICFAIKYNVI